MNISIAEARKIAVGSQGLNDSRLTISEILSTCACLQLDPLRVIRESHELVCLARGAAVAEAATLQTPEAKLATFVYPLHAMAILPLHAWPWTAMMRRKVRRNGWRGPAVDSTAVALVRDILEEKGVATTKDFTGARGSGWSRESPMRVAAEWLLWTGEAIATTRIGSRRVYALVERTLPPGLRAQEDLTDTQCMSALVAAAIGALGVGTVADIADYFRLNKARVESVLRDEDYPRAHVEGWGEEAWISRDAESLSRAPTSDRAVPLSPFDNLVWYRPRLDRMFGKRYSLEAYKPAHQRTFGHYFMPILLGHEIIGRVAPRRTDGAIVLEAVEFDSKEHRLHFEIVLERLNAWAGQGTTSCASQ